LSLASGRCIARTFLDRRVWSDEHLERPVVRAASLILCLFVLTSCVGLQRIAGSDSWRSYQPKAEDLRRVAEHGVQTVLCLRKGGPGRDWYEEEAALCRELGMELRHLGWSAQDDSQEQIERLTRALQELPGPYLIHCKHGVDRTGLAAAVFRVVVLGHPKKLAKSELSIWNGHLPAFGMQAMDRAWQDFRWPNPEETVASNTVTAP
jgi:protein tyrosine phosphatase (PTP) superfamily phosphohydrolase (DUF442 family)